MSNMQRVKEITNLVDFDFRSFFKIESRIEKVDVSPKQRYILVLALEMRPYQIISYLLIALDKADKLKPDKAS